MKGHSINNVFFYRIKIYFLPKNLSVLLTFVVGTLFIKSFLLFRKKERLTLSGASHLPLCPSSVSDNHSLRVAMEFWWVLYLFPLAADISILACGIGLVTRPFLAMEL